MLGDWHASFNLFDHWRDFQAFFIEPGLSKVQPVLF